MSGYDLEHEACRLGFVVATPEARALCEPTLLLQAADENWRMLHDYGHLPPTPQMRRGLIKNQDAESSH